MRLLLALIPLGLPIGATAQRVTPVSLPPAAARFEEPFTGVTSVRELSDGRVIVTDPRDKGLVVIDFESGSVETIGRQGQGPGEYGMASQLHPLAGDSSFMNDLQSRRWLLLDGPRIAVTVPPQDPAVGATGGIASGTDALGHVLARRSPPIRGGTTIIGPGDSSLVVLVSRRSGRADTITRVRQQSARMNARTDDKGTVISMEVRRNMFTAGEEPLLFPDGWLAVARLDPYRIDWRSPDGRWVHGAPLPFPAVRLTDREKRTQMEIMAEGSGAPARSPDAISDWPETLPPYATGALKATSDGRLLVHRRRSAEVRDHRYDVVNRRGSLDGQIAMPANQRIVGFGARSVYVVVTDDDGLQTLARHPWPPRLVPPR